MGKWAHHTSVYFPLSSTFTRIYWVQVAMKICVCELILACVSSHSQHLTAMGLCNVWHKSLQSTLKLAFIPPSIIQTTHQAVFTELLKTVIHEEIRLEHDKTTQNKQHYTFIYFIFPFHLQHMRKISLCRCCTQVPKTSVTFFKKMSHLKRTGLALAKSGNQEGFNTFHDKLLIDDSGSDRHLVFSENRSFQQKHVK